MGPRRERSCKWQMILDKIQELASGLRGRANAVAQGLRSAPSQAAQACRIPRRGRDRRARLHDVPAAAPDQAALVDGVLRDLAVEQGQIFRQPVKLADVPID